MKKLLLLVFAILLCACAKKVPVPQDMEPALAQRWEAMLRYGQAQANGPFRDQLSLRFGKEGSTSRVTATLWGNGDKDLRLDVQAGIGSLLARVLDSPNQFLLVSLRENKAYVHEGPDKPLLNLGSPLPFTLSRLAALINGQYGQAFGETYSSGCMLDNGFAEYALPNGSALTLDEEGAPVAWKQDSGWALAISLAADKLPRTLRFTQASGALALLTIREREKLPSAFTQAQLSLSVPDGFAVAPAIQLNSKN